MAYANAAFTAEKEGVARTPGDRKRSCRERRSGLRPEGIVIRGELWQLQDDVSLRRIDEAAVRLLTRTGCRIEHDGLLDMLEAAGCRIDSTGMCCYFPEALLREATSHIGRRQADVIEMPSGWGPHQRLHHGGSYPHLLEWPSGERRLATAQDVVDMARMAHVLDEIETVGKVLTCSEVDQRIEPLWAAVQLAHTTDKPIGGGEILYPGCIEPLVRMGEVITGDPGDTSLIAACDFFIAPLVLDGTQAACFLEKRRFGMANDPGTMPISGLSGPVTLAGTVAICVAELMAGWTLGYVVRPDLPATGIVASGSMDFRTMTACFGSPEALLQDFTAAQLCRRLYGIRVHPAWSYVDCKRPGLEAAYQKLLPLVGVAFGYGMSVSGEGLLSAGQDYSPVQHLLDAEIQTSVSRFFGSFDVSAETLALDLIEDVVGGQADFLTAEHTLSHYRREQWYPNWLDRTRWQNPEYEREAEARMMDRIDRYVRDAIARYRQPQLDEARLRELGRIFRANYRDILGKEETPLPEV